MIPLFQWLFFQNLLFTSCFNIHFVTTDESTPLFSLYLTPTQHLNIEWCQLAWLSFIFVLPTSFKIPHWSENLVSSVKRSLHRFETPFNREIVISLGICLFNPPGNQFFLCSLSFLCSILVIFLSIALWSHSVHFKAPLFSLSSSLLSIHTFRTSNEFLRDCLLFVSYLKYLSAQVHC